MSDTSESDLTEVSSAPPQLDGSHVADLATVPGTLTSASALGNYAFRAAVLRATDAPASADEEAADTEAADEPEGPEGSEEDLEEDHADPQQAKRRERRKRFLADHAGAKTSSASTAQNGGEATPQNSGEATPQVATVSREPSPAADRATAAALARTAAARRSPLAPPQDNRLQRLETTAHPRLGSSADNSDVNIIASGAATALTPTGPSTSGSSYLDFASGVETVTLDEDVTGGLARFRIFYGWTIVNVLLNDYGHAVWHASVPYTVDADQKVGFGSAIIEEQETGGSGATFSVNVGSGATPGGGYATVTAALNSSSSTTLGGGIGIGPISGSAPVQTTTAASGSFARSFTINLRPRPPQPIAGPQVAFKVGNAQLEDGQEGVIANWFQALPESAKATIRNGRRTINVAGYASTTSRRRRNRDLSEQRAHVVERILRGMAGSDAHITIFFFGEDAAGGPDEREDPQWRRATVQVTAPTAAAAAAPTALPAGGR